MGTIKWSLDKWIKCGTTTLGNVTLHNKGMSFGFTKCLDQFPWALCYKERVDHKRCRVLIRVSKLWELGSKPVDNIAPWLAPASFPALTSLLEKLELGKISWNQPFPPSCFWAWRFITSIEHLTKAINVDFYFCFF